MLKFSTLNDIGPALADYIKAKSDFNLNQVAENALNLHPANMSRKMRKNTLKYDEIEKICAYVGLKIEVHIGEMTFTTSEKQGNEKDLISAQKKYIDILEENRVLRTKLAEIENPPIA